MTHMQLIQVTITSKYNGLGLSIVTSEKTLRSTECK